jgi:hypothetical protein
MLANPNGYQNAKIFIGGLGWHMTEGKCMKYTPCGFPWLHCAVCLPTQYVCDYVALICDLGSAVRLRQFFQEYGEVLEVDIVHSRWTGRSRGFGCGPIAQ